MRTDRPYENFVIELEWRHLQPGGNAGLFVWSDALPAVGVPFTRSFEVQILDGQNGPNYTSHGDVFGDLGRDDDARPAASRRLDALPAQREAGASRRPSGTTTASPARTACSSWRSTARRSPAAAIASRARATSAWSRRARNATSATSASRSCPPPAPARRETATLDEGFISLYSGLDLRGWRSDPGHAGHWQAKDSILDYDGKSTARDKDLWTEKEYGDFVLIADWRLPGKPAPRAAAGRPAQRRRRQEPRRLRQDARDPLRRRQRHPAPRPAARPRSTSPATRSARASCTATGPTRRCRAEVRAGAIPKVKADSPPGKWNRFVITLKKDRVTVVLNGQTVIDNVQLPGIPARGPIGLQHHGDPVQFTNLFIKELE